MSILTVPVINDSPNTLNVSFQTEYAIPFEVACPDGIEGFTGSPNPTGDQPGGAGVLGGPEFVNFLQRKDATTLPARAFDYETFEMREHPGYSFVSFRTASLKADGTNKIVKTVVAFKYTLPGNGAALANVPCGVIATPTGAAASAAGVTGIFYPTPAGASGVTGLPAGSSLLWTGTAIGAVTGGQGTTGVAFTATGATGNFYVQAVLTLADGTKVTTSAPFATH